MPIVYEDKTGTIAITTCVIIGAIAGAIIGGIASKLIYGKVNGWWVLTGALIGGALGYVGGAFFGASEIKAGTLASKIQMSKVRWLGKIGGKMANLTFIIKVRETTQLSDTLKKLVDAGKIIIMYL